MLIFTVFCIISRCMAFIKIIRRNKQSTRKARPELWVGDNVRAWARICYRFESLLADLHDSLALRSIQLSLLNSFQWIRSPFFRFHNRDVQFCFNTMFTQIVIRYCVFYLLLLLKYLIILRNSRLTSFPINKNSKWKFITRCKSG